MNREEINKVYLKVREYLNKNGYINGLGVNFDFKTFENENDIPHLTYNNEYRKVQFFAARGKETISVVLAPYWHETLININDIEPDELYTLLQDVFYETEESGDYGDFEEDFLN